MRHLGIGIGHKSTERELGGVPEFEVQEVESDMIHDEGGEVSAPDRNVSDEGVEEEETHSGPGQEGRLEHYMQCSGEAEETDGDDDY